MSTNSDPGLPASQDPSPADVKLEARNIVKRFGNNIILDGVSLSAAPGSVTAIIGASGSGKSTFLRCVNLLIRPDAGELFLDGQRVDIGQRERDLLRYRCEIGMVFQSYNLFPHMTALENVIEAPMIVHRVPRAEATERAVVLLEKVRLGPRAAAYPHQLSGGEQQRVAIARALAMHPRVMLFDEVTSALDPELKGEVLATMRDLAADGMTMIVVSHEMSFVRQVASQVLFMSSGRIIEHGDPDAILDRPRSPELQAFVARIMD